MSSDQTRMPLDALDLQVMASGHLCLNLSEIVNWAEFPDYARKLLALVRGRKVSAAEAVDIRLWDVLVEESPLRLVYDDFPQMVSLESDSEEGDAVLRRLLGELRIAATETSASGGDT